MALVNDRSNKWLNLYNSSLGKKIITGITGFGLILFILFHMTGNLILLSDRDAYNQLAHILESLGFLFYGLELILLITALFHIAIGITIRWNSRQSRPIAYNKVKSIGQPSKQSLSSVSMAITGIIILGFLIWHLVSLKFGTYYSTTINGVPMRDLSKLVIEKFQQPIYVFGYLVGIACLGVHLRHGIWSAGQSLGFLSSRTSSFVYQLSSVLAVIVCLGFMVVPLVIYFNLG